MQDNFDVTPNLPSDDLRSDMIERFELELDRDNIIRTSPEGHAAAARNPMWWNSKRKWFKASPPTFEKLLRAKVDLAALLAIVNCPVQISEIQALKNDPDTLRDVVLFVFAHENLHAEQTRAGTDAGASRARKECDALKAELKFLCDMLDLPDYAPPPAGCNPRRAVLSVCKPIREWMKMRQCTRAGE